ncbi:MAG: single-stranded-DNA-specific exonuclease RecJ [Chthoniobacterales bacterium]
MQKKWILPSEVDSKTVARLAAEFQLPPPLAAILLQRGYDSVEKARSFLEPRLAQLRPPEEIPNISIAVDRLQVALQKKEKIILYGDYDVDGITSLTLLCRSLRALGGNVDCFIPERASEGYGLSQAGLERCFNRFQSTLLIAVDCGTNSVAEAEWIHKQQADLIVIDHHEIQNRGQAKIFDKTSIARQSTQTSPSFVKNFSLPPILVNPQLDDDYHYLCSVGLVFKLVHALLKRYPTPPFDLRDYLDLVALGTIADIVPLVGENRIFVAHGLKQLAKSRWPGVQALLKLIEVKPPLTTFDVGYKLGPRLNAAGRLSSALEALELLMTDDPIEAAPLARHLDFRNRERQLIEREVTLEAEALVTANFAKAPSKSIVLGRPHWHHGVVGIVASRISKRWHRPTLIIGFDEQGLGKGSGRSIEGFSLVAALGKCSHLLEAFGGHAMAAGLTVKETALELLCNTFEKTADALLTEEELLPPLRFHAELTIEELDFSWLSEQERLGPFGTANTKPLFLARSLQPLREPRILKEKHLRFEFAGKKNIPLTGIFFDGAREILPKPPWDIAFTLESNSYQGRTIMQLQIVAIREAHLG